MKGNKTIRIILGIVLLILLGIYLYLTGNARTNGKKFQELAAATPTVAPAETVQPEETPEVTEAPVETPEPSPEPVENSLPDIDITSWEFLLANPTHDIGEYAPTGDYIEGIGLDSRIIEPMREFVAAARAEGLSVYLSSGYRTYADQNYLYNRKIGQGYSPEDAAKIVAKPGTSEHQTGLACDITDVYRDPKTIEECESTATYQWMSQHCQEYGFIVRFPDGKSDITGIMYEPWHFRYVGTDAAMEMHETGECLEEYVARKQSE